jgi:uncharacterized repeat protein (TIGR03803 family)
MNDVTRPLHVLTTVNKCYGDITPVDNCGRRIRSGVTSRKAALLLASRSVWPGIRVRKSSGAMTHRSHPRSTIHLPLMCLLLLALASPASGDWKEKVLYSFQGGSDGSVPAGDVVFDKQGNLYGATSDGGSANDGTVFELMPPAKPGDAWTEAVLHVFRGYSSHGDGALLRPDYRRCRKSLRHD